MTDYTDPAGRAAASPEAAHAGGVTLINKFVVPTGRDEDFRRLWDSTSRYFRARPGFLSLRLHRALSPDAQYRFVNVARWATLADFEAAHRTEEFLRVVGQPGWSEFPSNPVLYEAVVDYEVESLAVNA